MLITNGVCIGGENACPPEDVGGPPGYEEFLAAMADPNHPEQRELKKWIGGSFEPVAFNAFHYTQRHVPFAPLKTEADDELGSGRV